MSDTSTPSQSGAYPSQSQVLDWCQSRGFPLALEARAMKLAEEAGEVMGAVVKLREGRKSLADLAQETAQLVMCCKGVAAAAGFDLDAAVADEWAEMQERTW